MIVWTSFGDCLARPHFEDSSAGATDEVGDVMHREAATPSRAVLLATHQPPLIRKVQVTGPGAMAPRIS